MVMTELLTVGVIARILPIVIDVIFYIDVVVIIVVSVNFLVLSDDILREVNFAIFVALNF